MNSSSTVRTVRTSPHFLGTFLTVPIHLRTHHVRTGNIQVLKNCPNLTSVNFYDCKIQGEHTWNELSPALLCAPVRTFVGMFLTLPTQ